MEKILFETLIFKYAYLDTMIDVTVKKREQNQLERGFTCKDWSHCFYRRSFKSVNRAVFVQSEDLSAYSTKNDELRKDSLQEYNSSVPWIEHEIITLLQKLDWKLYGRFTHSYKWKTNIPYTIGRRTILSSTFGSVQFVSTAMPSKQK